MTENEEKKLLIQNEREKTRKTAAVALGSAGLILMLAASGTEDYRDTLQNENERLGREVYLDKEIASPKETNTLLWGGALSLLVAGGLALKNTKER